MANERKIGPTQTEIRFDQASLELECPPKYVADLDWLQGEVTHEREDAATVGGAAEAAVEVEAVLRDGSSAKG